MVISTGLMKKSIEYGIDVGFDDGPNIKRRISWSDIDRIDIEIPAEYWVEDYVVRKRMISEHRVLLPIVKDMAYQWLMV